MFKALFAGFVALLATAPIASAQDYPTRPVKIVFPLAAGGGGDVFTRALADELQKAWHQPVLVENRPGGSTQVALLALSNMVPQLQSGRIVPLAVVANSRSPLFPDVPTLKEARGEQYPPTWFGLFTQGSVPRPIVDKIARDADRIMAQPHFRQRIYIERGVEPALERTDEFARFIAEERKLAQQIVQE